MPAVLNGANEVAVAAFLEGRIGFREIHRIIDRTMHAHTNHARQEVGEIMEVDRWARESSIGSLISRVYLRGVSRWKVFIYSIVAAVIGLGVLIVFHEFGHFLIAKLSGVGVLTFSVGFGPKLWLQRKARPSTP